MPDSNQLIEIDGVSVPAGTMFSKFSDMYVGPKVDKLQAETFIRGLANKYPGQGGATGSF